MTFKKLITAFTAVLMVVFIALSCFSVMAAGDVNGSNDPDSGIIHENPDSDGTDNDDTTPQVSYMAGDTNGDGKLDVNDVTMLQKVLVGLEKMNEVVQLNGDTFADGKINIWDATVIQYKLAKVYRIIPVTPDGYYAPIYQPS